MENTTSCENVTLLVLTYDQLPLLRQCLESVRNYNVVVIDNASKENIESVTSNFPNISEVIRFPENQGFAGAYNSAMDSVRTQYVILLSNDTIAAPGCIEELVRILESDSSIGISAPVLYNLDGSVQDIGWDLDFFGFPVEPQRKKENWEVFYASGCLLAMPTALFKQIGGFSRHFEFFVEDVDLCWKARLHGKRVVVSERAKLFHVRGATLGGGEQDSASNTTSARRTFFRERNIPLAFVQNLEFFQLLWRLPLYVVNSLFEALGMALAGQFPIAKEYFRAWKGFFGLLPVALCVRRKVQARRQVRDRYILSFLKMRNRKMELVFKRGLPLLKS